MPPPPPKLVVAIRCQPLIMPLEPGHLLGSAPEELTVCRLGQRAGRDFDSAECPKIVLSPGTAKGGSKASSPEREYE